MLNEFDEVERDEEEVEFGTKKSAVLESEEEEGAEVLHGDNSEFELTENDVYEDEEEKESNFARYEIDGSEDDLSLSF